MSSARPQPARVLFVDDDEGCRRAFTRCLATRGFDVQVSESVTDAYEKVKNGTFDVVATDLNLPGGGLALAARLSASCPHLPVLLVTGDTDFHLGAEAARTRSVAGIVFKPWDVNELVDALNQACNGGRRSLATPVHFSETVLLICADDERAQEWATRLEQTGDPVHEVIRKNNVQDAVPVAGSLDLRAVFLDVSGSKAATEDVVVLRRSTGHTIPIIAITDHHEDAIADEVLKAGAQDVLSSEVSAHALQRALWFATERQKADARATFLADHDPLTGLFNREVLTQHLARNVAAARRDDREVAVAILQLSGLANYQRRLGFSGIDALSYKVGLELSSLGRQLGTLARVGPGQFGWIAEKSELKDLTESVLSATQSALVGSPVPLGVHMGIAVYPENGVRAADLMKNAGFAVAEAKRDGVGHRFHSAELHDREARRWKMEQHLRSAIANNEFALVFQAQFELASNKPRAFEALLRWQSPEMGRTSPAEFIPILEETGLILDVGAWVLRTAVTAVPELRRKFGDDVHVAVNLSPEQFRDPSLLETIKHALAAQSLLPDCLELELTESMLVQDIDGAKEIMGGLHEFGVDLAVDDFGTGFSSLAYLKHFPIDVLKVDRVFVDGANKEESSERLLKGIVALGHGLGLRVVAEGVETKEELALLSEARCEYVQGYLLGRPASLEQHG